MLKTNFLSKNQSVCLEYIIIIIKKEIEKDLKKFISGLITIGTVKIYEHKRKQNLSSSMPEQGKAKSGRDSFRETTFYPRSVNWEITHRCNLKCIHCLIPLKERGVKKDVELTAEQIKEILYELQNLGTYEILFTGGEPFIRRDFTEIVAFASSMGFRLSINTNATLITDEIINVLKELNIYHLTVSVYGDEETHDKITGVKGSYKLMDENVRKMADCGMNLQLHFIVMKANYKTLNKVIASYSKILNYPNVEIIVGGDMVPRRDGDTFPLSLQVDDTIFLKCKELVHSLSTKATNSSEHNNRVHVCSAGRTQIFISPAGKVYPCMIINKKFLCGDLAKEKLSYIWKTSEVLKKFRKIKPSDFKECKDCKYKDICPFPCYLWNYLENGDIFKCAKRYKRIQKRRMAEGVEENKKGGNYGR